MALGLGLCLWLGHNPATSGGGAPDTTAPTLSSPTGSSTGSTTASLGVTTNEGNGTLYWVVTTSGTAPTKAQVKAGQNASGTAANASGSQAISSSGAKTASATGLTASTAYFAHFMHEDAAANQSNVVSSATFTTSAGSFTPASLPGLAAWIEADPTKLFVDAGLTPVSADGQAVQQANDKSGNGRNFSQATSTKRPLYRTGAGKPYLEFDGADDTLKSGSYAHTDGTGQHYVAIAGYINATGSDDDVFWSSTDESTTDFSRLYISFAGGATKASSFNGGSSTTDTGGSVSATTPFVIIMAITGTTIEVFLDNVSAGSTTLATQGANGNAFAYIGSLNGGANNSVVAGRIYGVVHGIGTLSSTDRASLQTYMAALHP